MLKIEKKEEFYTLQDENREFLRFCKEKGEIININSAIDNTLFSNLIKTSPLKDLELFITVLDDSMEEIKFLETLGFDFYAVSFNPLSEKIEEVYKYKYKETLYIKDNELKDILKKLEGGNI